MGCWVRGAAVGLWLRAADESSTLRLLNVSHDPTIGSMIPREVEFEVVVGERLGGFGCRTGAAWLPESNRFDLPADEAAHKGLFFFISQITKEAITFVGYVCRDLIGHFRRGRTRPCRI